MDTYSLEKGLSDGQKELLRFEYELAANKKEYKKSSYEASYGALCKKDKYMPDTKFKKWVHVIMRTLFVDSYRRIVCEQIFADRTYRFYSLDVS